jgi:hypothetical protein
MDAKEDFVARNVDTIAKKYILRDIGVNTSVCLTMLRGNVSAARRWDTRKSAKRYWDPQNNWRESIWGVNFLGTEWRIFKWGTCGGKGTFEGWESCVWGGNGITSGKS